jgi:hypothetical protein
LPFEDEKETINVIMKVSHDFKQAMAEPNMWGSFQAIAFEFEFDPEVEPYRLLFNEEKLRQSEGFRDLWSIDFPPGSTIESVAQHQIWLHQQAKVKWFGPSGCLCHWSATRISLCVKKQKSGIIARFTA